MYEAGWLKPFGPITRMSLLSSVETFTQGNSSSYETKIDWSAVGLVTSHGKDDACGGGESTPTSKYPIVRPVTTLPSVSEISPSFRKMLFRPLLPAPQPPGGASTV